MTTEQIENPAEEFLQELGDVYGEGPDFRANVPVGTEIGQQSVAPGLDIRWNKSSSKQRMGLKELPDRVALYDRQRHDVSMVPPVIANTRMTTHPGRFTLRKPATWDSQDRKPIDETCEICTRNRKLDSGPDTPPKKFYAPEDLRDHMRYMHQNEWEAIEQNRRDQERREDNNRFQNLVLALITVLKPDAAAKLPEEVREQIAALQEEAEAGEPAKARRTRT